MVEIETRIDNFLSSEDLSGFSIEYIPQINTEDQADINALGSLAGMRAVWLLYRLGKWEHLEDLGVCREQVEPVLKQFRYGNKLNQKQVQQLRKKVPELVEASKELRTAYALKYPELRERFEHMEMDNYIAEVSTAREARDAVARHTQEIAAAGGSIEAGYGADGDGAIILVHLPASLGVSQENVLSGSGLKFVKQRRQDVPVPRDMGKNPWEEQEDA